MPSVIRKLVVPAAGMGTRLLPASKAVPKEMLPIAGKPLIQLAVEEAVASGVQTLIFVISKNNGVLVEHFRRNIELENVLRQRAQYEAAELIRELADLAEIRTVVQHAPLGLAHAIGCVRSQVSDEPFAVILPDAVIDSEVPCIRQLMDCYARHPGCIVATQLVDPSEVDRFGMVDVVPISDSCCSGRTMRVTSFTERPAIGGTSSRYGILGRYILEPEIFESIEHTSPGFAGELQLTDSLLLCSSRVPVYAYRFEGTHYDVGSKLGFVQATLAYALKDPDLGPSVREQMAELESELGCGKSLP
jgi:UTP--glucose-1-phosphate uridylyltransferase